MNTAAKLLTNDPSIKFHALQIIFIRMLCTGILCSIYSWYKGVPEFPFGPRGVRGLLILRGASGFVGLFGIYCESTPPLHRISRPVSQSKRRHTPPRRHALAVKIKYRQKLMHLLDSLAWLGFSDATVITFIVPTTTAIVCFFILREPFTWKEALCSVVAFSGVLFVARPPWLFPETHHMSPGPDEPNVTVPSITPQQRALAVTVAIVGTLGASTAYSTIRIIGKRAHSLISVLSLIHI